MVLYKIFFIKFYYVGVLYFDFEFGIYNSLLDEGKRIMLQQFFVNLIYKVEGFELRVILLLFFLRI